MSYDISLRNRESGETVTLDAPHALRGGTYAMGGTPEAWLNVTYNYSPHFRKVFGDGGIRSLYGKTAAESIPLLKAAIGQLGTDVRRDYWESTEGNAREALMNMLTLAQLAPAESVWGGD